MFTFNANDVIYQVKFHHSPHVLYPTKKQRRVTTCIIRNMNDESITFGTATCSRKDNFCKVKGRELAMARVLLDTFPGSENKDIRCQIWLQYNLKMEDDRMKSWVKESVKSN